MEGDGFEELPKIEILPATPEDARAIQQLMYESVRATYPNEETGVTMDDVMDFYKDEFSPKGLEEFTKKLTEPETGVKNFVAKDKGIVVGYCRARENDDENLLSRIHVLPNRKGERIGSLLWKQAQGAFNPTKDTALWVVDYNENAISTYRKWGFKDADVPKRDDLLKSGAHRIRKKMVLKAPPTSKSDLDKSETKG